MNKISFGQFASILLVSDAFALICYSKSLSFLTLICFLIAVAVQFLIAIQLSKYNIPKDNRLLLWVYLISAILWGTLLFIRVWQISETIYIPVPDIPLRKLLISVLIAIVCVYSSSPGIKALSRASVITAGFGVWCIIFIIFGSLNIIKVENIFIQDTSDVFSQIILGFSIGGSFCILPYLSSQLKDNKSKSISIYFAIKSLFYILVIILSLMTAGGIMEITEFPIIFSAQLCQPFSSQRIDALFITVLVIFAVMGITVQTVTASQIIETIFPKCRKFKSTMIIIIMLIMALILGKTDIYSIFYAIIFLIPSILTLILLFSKRGVK